MRLPWPFRRSPEPGPDPGPGNASRTTAGGTEPGPGPRPRAWSTLPPIQRTVGAAPLVAPAEPFLEHVPGAQPLPPILRPLTHDVGPTGPPGLVVASTHVVPSLTSGRPLTPARLHAQRRSVDAATDAGPAAAPDTTATQNADPDLAAIPAITIETLPAMQELSRALGVVPSAAVDGPPSRPLTRSAPLPSVASGASAAGSGTGSAGARRTNVNTRMEPATGVDHGSRRPGLGPPLRAGPTAQRSQALPGAPSLPIARTAVSPPDGGSPRDPGTMPATGSGGPLGAPSEPAARSAGAPTRMTVQRRVRQAAESADAPQPAGNPVEARPAAAPDPAQAPPEPRAASQAATTSPVSGALGRLPVLPVARRAAASGRESPTEPAPASPGRAEGPGSRAATASRGVPTVQASVSPASIADPTTGASPAGAMPTRPIVGRRALASDAPPSTGERSRFAGSRVMPEAAAEVADVARATTPGLGLVGTTGGRPVVRTQAPAMAQRRTAGGMTAGEVHGDRAAIRRTGSDAGWSGGAALGLARPASQDPVPAAAASPTATTVSRSIVGAPAATLLPVQAVIATEPGAAATSGPGMLPGLAATAVVQRVDGAAPPPPSPRPGHTDDELDELARALFGRFRNRLRTEYIHEREARGRTFDNV